MLRLLGPPASESGRLKPERLTGLYGNLPIAWSLMLALRARGVGVAWTTIVFTYEEEVAALLGIPENLTRAACLPVAYFTGTISSRLSGSQPRSARTSPERLSDQGGANPTSRRRAPARSPA